jgi:hypothetical protein
MAIASDPQVQSFCDTTVRPRCAAIRDLYLALQEDKARFDDIYANITQGSPSWTDSGSALPHHATTGDILAWNTFITAFIAFVNGTATATDSQNAAAQYPVVRKLCTSSL